MDKILVNVDLLEFQAALDEYVKESRLDVADAVNKKAGDVAFKAATARQVNGNRPKGKLNKLGKESKLWHALATGKTKFGVSKKGAAVKNQGNAAVAQAIWESRLRHIHYSKSLFLRLAQKFGKKVKALRASNTVENVAAKPATKGMFDKPEAILEILGVDADHETILDEAMLHGLRGQTADMRKYLDDKIAKRAKAHSGR